LIADRIHVKDFERGVLSSSKKEREDKFEDTKGVISRGGSRGIIRFFGVKW
jgi:hypothetical protein